jgi:ferredoxin
MKVAVEHDLCIGDGICESICPQVFVLGEDGLSYVIADDVAEDLRDDVQEAVDSCPTECIHVFDDEDVPEDMTDSIRPDMAN